ncbi:MAG TPA: agmatinase [Candidatus Binatia bacterium]|nr:agmatinase [Candidatus Binatia bacterium]
MSAPAIAETERARAAAQQPALDYIRSGQTPFFRLPLCDAERRRGSRERAGAVVLGVPYDGGATVHAGARLAPYHVRRVSAFLQPFHPYHQVDVFEATRAVDGGNVAFPPFDPHAVREAIRAEVADVLAGGAVPILLGGDHSIALPALRAAAERHGPLAVVHVDAHPDTSDDAVWGDAYHHGTPLRHALEERLVEDGQLYQVGVRAPSADALEASFSRRRGARVYTAFETAERGVDSIAADVRRRIGDRKTYLTFDVDAIDPAFAPGTGTPVPGGLTSREAIQLVRGLAGVSLVGMDVVEVCPALDHADLTCHLAAHLLYEGLGLVALRADAG